MKKAGILTFHRAKNYGALVQCYSLLTKLKYNYPDCQFEIIDYRTAAERNYYFRSLVRSAVKESLPNAWDELTRNFLMNRFSDNLPLNGWRITDDETERLFRKLRNHYDLIIVGSDAVFNWSRRKFPTAYLLGEDFGCPKVSYAASAHKLPYREVAPEQIEYCKAALNGFSYIGVRDSETENFVRYCDEGLTSHHNCDPTILLDMETLPYESARKKLDSHGVNLKKPIIAVMTASAQLVEQIFERYNNSHEFISLYVHNPLIKKHIANLEPLEWAGVFKFAALTVTEYFHGTLLSLKNNTPVISFDSMDYTKGYEGKLRDFMFRRSNLDEMAFSFSDLLEPDFKDRVLSVAERGMDGAFSERISEAMAHEELSFSSFDEYLNSILKT